MTRTVCVASQRLGTSSLWTKLPDQLAFDDPHDFDVSSCQLLIRLFFSLEHIIPLHVDRSLLGL
jgi:hypothetical protein